MLLVILLSGCKSSIVYNNPPTYFNLKSSLENSDLPNSFILIGDTQRTGWFESTLLFRESSDSVQFELFSKIASLDNKPSFIVHLGDLVYDASSDSDWEYFDSSTSMIRKEKIPIVPLLGNHEYFGDYEKGNLNITSRFPEFKDSSWKSFKFKNVGFILLNTNIELSEKLKKRQKEWYNNELERFDSDTGTNHIIIATHQPPFTNGNGLGFGDDEYVKHNFIESYKKYSKAKLFVSGHCHNYEHLLIDNKHYVVTGGGGGPRRTIDLEGRYKDITNGIDKDKCLRDFHFISVEVKKDSLVLVVHNYNMATKRWGIGDKFSL